MDYGKFGNCLEGRLYAIRKDQKLNQEEFGKRLGVTRSAICNYEGGTRPIGEQVIRSVCREFGVNEIWLRQGIGNPYEPQKKGAIDRLIQEYGCSKFEGDFLKAYFQMDVNERSEFVRCFYRLFKPFFSGLDKKNPFVYYFDWVDEGDTGIFETSATETCDPVAEAEHLYEKSSGFVRPTGLSASNTTGGGATGKKKATTDRGGGESGNVG